MLAKLSLKFVLMTCFFFWISRNTFYHINPDTLYCYHYESEIKTIYIPRFIVILEDFLSQDFVEFRNDCLIAKYVSNDT